MVIKKIIVLFLMIFILVQIRADIIDDILKNTANAQQHQALTEAKKRNFDEALKLIDIVLSKTNNSPAVRCDKIVILAMASKNSEAIKNYKELPSKYKIPDYLKPVITKCFYETDSFAQIVEILEPDVKKFAKNDTCMELLARSYIALGNMKKAEEIQKKAGRSPEWLNAQNAEVKHKKGVEAARAGKYEEADKLLSEAYILDKNNPQIIFDKVVNLSWAGRHKAALKTFDLIPPDTKIPEYVLAETAKSLSSQKLYAKSDAICEKILSEDKSNLNARKILIGNLIAQKKFKDAEKKMDTPELRNSFDSLLAESLRQDAAELSRAGKYEDADKIFREAYSKDKTNNAILFDMIVNLSWSGKYQNAISLFKTIPAGTEIPEYLQNEMIRAEKESSIQNKTDNFYSEKENNKDAAFATVSLLANSGEYEKAEDIIKKRTAQVPDEKASLTKILVDGLRKKAVTEARAGRIEAARTLMDEALKEAANDPLLLTDYITILSWNNMPQEALSYYAKLPKDYDCPDYLTDAVAKAFRDTGNFEKSAELYYKLLEKNPGNKKAIYGYMFSKIQSGKKEDAIKLAEKNNKLNGKIDCISTAMLGKAYFEGGMINEAEMEFQKVLSIDPSNPDALIGSSQICLKNRNWAEAEKYSDQALSQLPDDIEALYCKAEASEGKGNMPAAFRCYEKISNMSGGERANSSKYRVLSSMGGTGLALSMLKQKKELPQKALMEKLMGDEAVARISRLEASKAVELLDRNLYEASSSEYKDFTFRTRYDKFIANRQLLEMKKIMEDYDKLLEEKITPPYWVTQAAADANLYMRNPRTSLKLYRQVEKQMAEMNLDQYPDNYELQMAIYYNLVELERFSEATVLLNSIEKQINEYMLKRGGISVQNWDYTAVIIEKAWLLIFQDKLSEAEEYVKTTLEQMPYNTNIRTAQAYLHFYRGWPRKALEDFQIISAIDPEDRAGKVGLCYALDANDEGQKARAIAKDLTDEYPNDLAIQKLNRSFEIDDMRKETVGFQYDREQNQTGDVVLFQRLEQPIYPHRKVYLETVWKHVTKGDLEDDSVPNSKEVFRNIAGFDWRLDRDFTIFGGASIDYQGQHPGGEGGIQYTPDDHWTIKAYYNSYSLDAPGWIYLDNGYAQEYYVETKYRMSEDFEAEVKFDQMFLSDHNIMSTVSARQDKLLTSSADWKTHMAMEESLSMATKTDTAYYSPQYNVFVYFVPYVEHLWFRRYDFAINDKFYLAPGMQIEKDNGTAFAGYIKYENEVNFTDTISLVTGLTGTSKNYDGERSYGFSVFSTFVFHF